MRLRAAVPTVDGVRLRYLALQYAWAIASRELLRSSRWSGDQKARAMVFIGMLISGPVTLVALWWLLTGRGPGRWMFGRVFVNPFRRQMPADVRAGMLALKKAAADTARAAASG